MSAVVRWIRLAPPGALGVSLLGCLLTANPAYEDTGESTTEPPPEPGTTTTGEPSFPCPGDLPFTMWYPDADADSYGDRKAEPVMACEAPAGHVPDSGDCNDKVAEIHPKLLEKCNGFDDNCNSLVDESSQDCGTCVIEVTETHVYWICAHKSGIAWAEAEQRCVDRSSKQTSVRLASIHSADEQTRLAELAALHVPPVGGIQRVWLGLIKRASQSESCDLPDPLADWQWNDGSPFDLDPPWNATQPDNAPADCTCDPATGCLENCGELTIVPAQKLTGWSDTRCDAPTASGFICKTRRDPVLFP